MPALNEYSHANLGRFSALRIDLSRERCSFGGSLISTLAASSATQHHPMSASCFSSDLSAASIPTALCPGRLRRMSRRPLRSALAHTHPIGPCPLLAGLTRRSLLRAYPPRQHPHCTSRAYPVSAFVTSSGPVPNVPERAA